MPIRIVNSGDKTDSKSKYLPIIVGIVFLLLIIASFLLWNKMKTTDNTEVKSSASDTSNEKRNTSNTSGTSNSDTSNILKPLPSIGTTKVERSMVFVVPEYDPDKKNTRVISTEHLANMLYAR